MKTKNIFKTLALAMLMPAMLLTTACSNDDDAVNTENTAKKGYALPVTINVTRQDDNATTRASYNEGTKKLGFSTGDKLFVEGDDGYTAGGFAGTLTWVSDGTFSGIIYTDYAYYGTAQELLTSAEKAILLPAGYGSYGFLTIKKVGGSDYDNQCSIHNSEAFALTKADAVEQFSYETSTTYSSGFALSPQNAVLNFTITGLTASTEVAVVFNYSTTTVSKNVTTDGSGNATFAIGVRGNTDLNSCTLTVGGNAITLVSSSKDLTAGKIYNINRSAAPAPAFTMLSAATSSDYGKVVCAAGHLHTAKTAVPAGCTAVGILGKVTETGHGLILALHAHTGTVPL